jgi:hypothetical protein
VFAEYCQAIDRQRPPRLEVREQTHGGSEPLSYINSGRAGADEQEAPDRDRTERHHGDADGKERGRALVGAPAREERDAGETGPEDAGTEGEGDSEKAPSA